MRSVVNEIEKLTKSEVDPWENWEKGEVEVWQEIHVLAKGTRTSR